MTLRNSVIVRNDAKDTGGGIFAKDRGRVTIAEASDIVDNDPNNCVGTTACGV